MRGRSGREGSLMPGDRSSLFRTIHQCGIASTSGGQSFIGAPHAASRRGTREIRQRVRLVMRGTESLCDSSATRTRRIRRRLRSAWVFPACMSFNPPRVLWAAGTLTVGMSPPSGRPSERLETFRPKDPSHPQFPAHPGHRRRTCRHACQASLKLGSGAPCFRPHPLITLKPSR
jgi:hypothetical protein